MKIRSRSFLTVSLLSLLFATPAVSHEDRHTHAELSVASVYFLDSPNVAKEEQRLGWAPGRIAQLLRQGSIDEDQCPLYYNHLYNPVAANQLPPVAGDLFDDNCNYTTATPNYPPDPYYDSQNPNTDLSIAQQTAPQRAAANWNAAVQYYASGDYVGAYLLVGHVLHLMQDMTSPAHVHNDPHGKARFQGGDGDCAFQQDADDFENWGWCRADENVAAYKHIFDYLYEHGTTGPDGTNIKTEARTGLDLIFGGEPQFAPLGATENPGRKYVEHVASVVFNFTTFEVKVRDEENGTDPQPSSELKTMFPSLSEGGFDNFVIEGEGQDIGFSDAHCERWEGTGDFHEEWWPMEHNVSYPCTRTTFGNDNTETLDGWAYIENSGGDGSDSGGTWDSLRPRQYARHMYELRYGTTGNPAGRTQLRIYGDVLYPTAIAYGSGLIQTFVDDQVDAPVADAGGPYVSDGCLPIVFDASGSHDTNADGTIVSYAWDFDDDGTIDLTTDQPIVSHAYSEPFDGEARLVVTDDDGFVGEATTHVTVDPDLEPPVIESIGATPNRLWPPNKQMVPVTVSATATDRCGATCAIVEVTSDEQGPGRGRGHDPDWVITGDLTLTLRAERLGSGDGREYRILVECSDPMGNASEASTTVTVPHDNGGGNGSDGRSRPAKKTPKHRAR